MLIYLAKMIRPEYSSSSRSLLWARTGVFIRFRISSGIFFFFVRNTQYRGYIVHEAIVTLPPELLDDHHLQQRLQLSIFYCRLSS